MIEARLQHPTHQTTQEQIESVRRVGFTFYTEHRILGCFLLNSFRLGWGEEKQERLEISETGNTDRNPHKDRVICKKKSDGMEEAEAVINIPWTRVTK